MPRDRTLTLIILTHQKTSCQRMTQLSQIFTSMSCLKPQTCSPKRLRKWRDISMVFRNIHSIQALADHTHSKRLDTRQSVYGDGDCLFSATWLSVVNVVYAFSLRMQLCKHMKDKLHVDQLKKNQFTTEDDFSESYQCVQQLKILGTQGTDVNDLLQLALPNFIRRRVKMFCSRKACPISDVIPTIEQLSIFNPICLALFVPTGQPEHCDG